MRVLLAEDHAIVRAGLSRILELEFGALTIAEATTCAELLARASAGPWDLLILDVSLGSENTLNVLPELKRACPDLPVIVLSMYGERQFVRRALAAGAAAYLTKEKAADDELFRAIRSVLAGRRYIGPDLAEQLADDFAAARRADPHEALSTRELEVFLLLASARSVTEIAEQLMISVKTVSTYRTRILEKTGLGSNAAVMQYALRRGLVG